VETFPYMTVGGAEAAVAPEMGIPGGSGGAEVEYRQREARVMALS
jgi:hypothetical protein